MAVFSRELKSNFKGFCIWTASITFMIAVCIFMFPEMKNQMDSVSSMFSDMGGFTEAFGMDRLDFGTLIGFYGIECGNVLGIGGAFFAAFIGISILSKEEKDRTAEFLLTHPVSRISIITQKLLSAITQIVLMNAIVFAVGILCIAAIKEEIPFKEFALIHAAFTVLQLEIGFICFGISAFIRRGSIGIGLGLAAIFYFMNIIKNISDQAEFLKYITPFAYAESADIVADAELNMSLIAIGVVYAVAALILGYVKYNKKDIAA